MKKEKQFIKKRNEVFNVKSARCRGDVRLVSKSAEECQEINNRNWRLFIEGQTGHQFNPRNYPMSPLLDVEELDNSTELIYKCNCRHHGAPCNNVKIPNETCKINKRPITFKILKYSERFLR